MKWRSFIKYMTSMKLDKVIPTMATTDSLILLALAALLAIRTSASTCTSGADDCEDGLTCRDSQCQSPCDFGPWSAWSPCSIKSCEPNAPIGVRNRSRVLIAGPASCNALLNETDGCVDRSACGSNKVALRTDRNGLTIYLPADQDVSFKYNDAEPKNLSTLLHETLLDGLVDLMSETTRLAAEARAIIDCNQKGLVYNASSSASDKCDLGQVRLPQNAAPCSVNNTGEIRFDAVREAVALCTAQGWRFIDDRPDGRNAVSPGESCASILALGVNKDGWYYIKTSKGVKQLYCDMQNGGWTRVAFMQATSAGCRNQYAKDTYQNLSTYTYLSAPQVCYWARTTAGCGRQTLYDHGISYTKVRGQAVGKQHHSMDGFSSSLPSGSTDSPNGTPLDGFMLTRFSPNREHVWSFAVGFIHKEDEYGNPGACPCRGGAKPPAFIGTHYFCESGNDADTVSPRDVWYPTKLWDGKPCLGCDCHGWFERTFTKSTYNAFEMNMCADSASNNEDVGIEKLEVYIK
eukprot:TRINITY_DN10911_c0_g1_i1.p1 TRINITY_DN10911_c0_g1~~TRINITY_DN10911_c0_g1_i1.p1  ORF type:complete len:518 (+),score=65.52 TRINITY_DN10911_c0_g1_i1:293-1846(+)